MSPPTAPVTVCVCARRDPTLVATIKWRTIMTPKTAGAAIPSSTGQPRPTPLHPYPQPQPHEKEEGEKVPPLELGTDAIAILEGRTFMLSNAIGDVPPRSMGGLLH